MSQRVRHLPPWLLNLDDASESSKNVKRQLSSAKRNDNLPKQQRKFHKSDEVEENLDKQNTLMECSKLGVKPLEQVPKLPFGDTTDRDLPENYSTSENSANEQTKISAICEANDSSNCNEIVTLNDIPGNSIEQDDMNGEELSSTGIDNIDENLTGVGNENISDTAEQVTEDNGHANDDEDANPKIPRATCKYGSSCYRRNPKHLLDFSHPGDEDYSDTDNRPECKYGTSCYRKNPLHKQHFKHTLPRRVKRPKKDARSSSDDDDDDDDASGTTKNLRKARQAKRAKKDESDSEDDYDFDDPFLNDGSSDDYNPTNSDSDTDMSAEENNSGSEEDTRRLRKDAKKFLKKKN